MSDFGTVTHNFLSGFLGNKKPENKSKKQPENKSKKQPENKSKKQPYRIFEGGIGQCGG
jgi:hypothetical protein